MNENHRNVRVGKISGFEIALHEFPPFDTGSVTATGLENGADTANSM
jgi:hypothetical protein